MTTAWADLPNATHIDWVLASLESEPWEWTAAHGAARGAAWTAAWTAAWDAAQDTARPAAWAAAQDTARAAARAATWAATWAAARDAARDACAALVAWDDCAVLLDLPTDAVRLLAHSGHHPAVLLLPAVIVRSGD